MEKIIWPIVLIIIPKRYLIGQIILLSNGNSSLKKEEENEDEIRIGRQKDLQGEEDKPEILEKLGRLDTK